MELPNYMWYIQTFVKLLNELDQVKFDIPISTENNNALETAMDSLTEVLNNGKSP